MLIEYAVVLGGDLVEFGQAERVVAGVHVQVPGIEPGRVLAFSAPAPTVVAPDGVTMALLPGAAASFPAGVGRAWFRIAQPAERIRRAFPRWRLAPVLWSAAGHAVLLVLMAAIPPSPRTLDATLGSREGRVAPAAFVPREDPVPLTTGPAGRGIAPAPRARPLPRDGGSGAGASRQGAVDAARSAGILGVLRGGDGPGSAWSSITAADTTGSGPGPGAGRDVGFGTRPGAEPGGPARTIGVGRYSTDGARVAPRVAPRGRPPSAPVVRAEPARVEGGLDRAVIRRYVRRAVPRVRACYERALVGDPDLVVTVVVDFTISPRGAVLGATAGGGTLGNCVARAVRAVRFPASPGASRVRYPFTLRRAGAGHSANRASR